MIAGTARSYMGTIITYTGYVGRITDNYDCDADVFDVSGGDLFELSSIVISLTNDFTSIGSPSNIGSLPDGDTSLGVTDPDLSIATQDAYGSCVYIRVKHDNGNDIHYELDRYCCNRIPILNEYDLQQLQLRTRISCLRSLGRSLPRFE